MKKSIGGKISHDVCLLDGKFDVLFYMHSYWEHVSFGAYPTSGTLFLDMQYFKLTTNLLSSISLTHPRREHNVEENMVDKRDCLKQ